MAWVEHTGREVWRVRYRDGRTQTVCGFTSETAAQAHADRLTADLQLAALVGVVPQTVDQWVSRWLVTLDVETRTDENYRAYLRNHILPAGATRSWRCPSVGGVGVGQTATSPVRDKVATMLRTSARTARTVAAATTARIVGPVNKSAHNLDLLGGTAEWLVPRGFTDCRSRGSPPDSDSTYRRVWSSPHARG
jgi:hypothetical protein